MRRIRSGPLERTGLMVALATLATFSPPALHAQPAGARALVQTELIRLTTSEGASEFRFHAWEPEALIVTPADAWPEPQLRISVRDLTRIEVRTPAPRGRSALRGTARGALVGGLLGAAFGFFGDLGSGQDSFFSRSEVTVLSALLVGIPGAAIGLVVGAIDPGTHWTPLEAPWVIEPGSTP